MPFEALMTVDIIETLENYIQKIRPPEEIRPKLDLGYQIEGQSIILVEIRPDWKDKTVFKEYGYAKATFIKRQGIWKVYWLSGNLKWITYEPKPEVKSLKKFLDLVEEDKYRCFKG